MKYHPNYIKVLENYYKDISYKDFLDKIEKVYFFDVGFSVSSLYSKDFSCSIYSLDSCFGKGYPAYSKKGYVDDETREEDYNSIIQEINDYITNHPEVIKEIPSYKEQYDAGPYKVGSSLSIEFNDLLNYDGIRSQGIESNFTSLILEMDAWDKPCEAILRKAFEVDLDGLGDGERAQYPENYIKMSPEPFTPPLYNDWKNPLLYDTRDGDYFDEPIKGIELLSPLTGEWIEVEIAPHNEPLFFVEINYPNGMMKKMTGINLYLENIKKYGKK